MDSPDTNLFDGLFAFRPRIGYTPQENFLTEALAYVVRTDAHACTAWLRALTDGAGEFEGVTILTRNAEADDDGKTIYPDVRVQYRNGTGATQQLKIEHKWNSVCDLDQLRKYARVIERDGVPARLVFVGVSRQQVEDAERFERALYPHVTFRALRWESIYRALNTVPEKARLLQELLDFMLTQGLGSMRPISAQQMLGYVQSRDFIAQLLEYANKLRMEYDWSCVPARYTNDSPVQEQYGRVAIVFGNEHWAPAITVGFLYDNKDHRVPFTTPDVGIDLFLRIEATPRTNRNPTSVLAALGAKREALEQLGAVVRMKGAPDNRNSHTLLIAQYPLSTVINAHPGEQDQIDEIYRVLQGWCRALFEDGLLEPHLATLQP